jgi:hypothetical protein
VLDFVKGHDDVCRLIPEIERMSVAKLSAKKSGRRPEAAFSALQAEIGQHNRPAAPVLRPVAVNA